MSNSQQQPDAGHHEQVPPPVRTFLTTSSSTLALDGNTSFIINTTYECTAARLIWALIHLFSDFTTGIKIRDTAPLRDASGNLYGGRPKYRRLGPQPTRYGDPDDDGNIDIDDTELVHLALDEKFSTSYTVSTVPKLGGIVNSDTRLMVAGGTYEITLKRRRWRWMFEDEMGGEMSEEERRQILEKREIVEWAVDNRVTFEAA